MTPISIRANRTPANPLLSYGEQENNDVFREPFHGGEHTLPDVYQLAIYRFLLCYYST